MGLAARADGGGRKVHFARNRRSGALEQEETKKRVSEGEKKNNGNAISEKRAGKSDHCAPINGERAGGRAVMREGGGEGGSADRLVKRITSLRKGEKDSTMESALREEGARSSFRGLKKKANS